MPISQDQWDNVVKENLFNVFHKHFRDAKGTDPKKGDMTTMISKLADQDILTIIKKTPTYNEIYTSQRSDQNLVRIVRDAGW